MGAITRGLMPSKKLGSAVTINGEVAALEFAELLFLPADASGEDPQVDVRRLHQLLGSKQEFSNWVLKRAKECQPVVTEDYGVFNNSIENSQVGRPTKDYWLTMDAAKGFSMMERNA